MNGSVLMATVTHWCGAGHVDLVHGVGMGRPWGPSSTTGSQYASAQAHQHHALPAATHDLHKAPLQKAH